MRPSKGRGQHKSVISKMAKMNDWKGNPGTRPNDKKETQTLVGE